MKRSNDTTTKTDQALVSAASRGDDAAFAELHRRHAPLAWRLGLAVTGDPDTAAAAVAEATGTTFTALRAGRFQANDHGTALAAATRNAALDLRRSGTSSSPVVGDDADPLLATAFTGLPERWRSVLWLRDAERLPAGVVAPIVELTAEGVDQLAVRARLGLRDRYLRANVATTADRDCGRAVVRLGAMEDGTLNQADRETLEHHLENCLGCADRAVRVGSLAAALPALAVPPTDDLLDRSRAAWTAALASSTATGLSPRTEKVLAGASAFAAAVGVLGAALFGTGGGSDPVASPLAPLVADIDTPKPVDLSDLVLPLTTPDAITSNARRSLSPSFRSAGDGAELAAPAAAAGESSGGATTPGTTDDGLIPAAETPSNPLPTAPVSVDPDDSSIDVGGITGDLTPEDGTVVDIPGDTDDPITNPLNEVLAPVVEAAEPVLEATEPVTTTVTDTVTTVTDTLTSGGGLGL
ncbi:MAG TPA: hypothetical protein VFU14_00120 [Acidimicrobiales bacterium]|nr:hypothetical protein [Acidimicrobiales bacterium]